MFQLFAAAGAGIGAMFGPIGAAIGGVTGAGLWLRGFNFWLVS